MAPIHPESGAGRGRHAIVFECRDPSGRIYAMKLFKQDSRDRIRRELEIFQYLENGPNIIKFIDAVQGEEGSDIGIVLEYVDNTDFRTLYPRFNDMDIRYYTRELLRALDFAHSQGVMHRDVRPHNVLRLIGWSSADFYRPDEDLGTCVGLWKPPELLLSYERYDFSIDMWCFGAMLAAMIFRKEPFFHGVSLIDQLRKIAEVLGTDKLYRFVNEYDLELNDEELEALGQHHEQAWTDFINSDNEMLVSDEALSLIDQLLRFDPKARATYDC
ncbi:CMGC CK2 kinase [Fusarium globosum]|uniref:non-specific serine/threonine protein kinase n=1 Tax=Fusarium globosum TaxID=78864 RepID=A0A8H6D7B5_9HYPO|nr:CMGC CK2 kinase [Fusarium globosum]